MKIHSFNRKEFLVIKLSLLFCINLFLGQVNAQSDLNLEIHISSVYKKRDHFLYSNELKFSSSDSSVWLRKNNHRRFKELNQNVPAIFTEKETFQTLDSIFTHIQEYPTLQFYKKSKLYRIQLIDHSLNNGIVLTKTIEFPYGPNGNEDFLSTLIAEYRALNW